MNYTKEDTTWNDIPSLASAPLPIVPPLIHKLGTRSISLVNVLIFGWLIILTVVLLLLFYVIWTNAYDYEPIMETPKPTSEESTE